MSNIAKRLRNTLLDWGSDMPVIGEAAAEIERLTAREEQRAERLRLYMNRIGELEADNERLLAALQEIEDFPYVGAQASQKIRGIARRAREPKP